MDLFYLVWQNLCKEKKNFFFFWGIPIKFNFHVHSKLLYNVRILDPDPSIFTFQEEYFLWQKLSFVNCSKTEIKSGDIIYLRNNIMYVLLSNGSPRPCSLQKQCQETQLTIFCAETAVRKILFFWFCGAKDLL